MFTVGQSNLLPCFKSLCFFLCIVVGKRVKNSHHDCDIIILEKRILQSLCKHMNTVLDSNVSVPLNIYVICVSTINANVQ